MISDPILAANKTKGAEIFATNCAVCHRGGGNVIVAYKTLKKDALSKYLKGFDRHAEASVIDLITNGEHAMPGFKGYLSKDDIKKVATYVVQQAQTEW
ncbi:MAG: c-type cytochrome [Microcoleaceae cyanobacterium]